MVIECCVVLRRKKTLSELASVQAKAFWWSFSRKQWKTGGLPQIVPIGNCECAQLFCPCDVHSKHEWSPGKGYCAAACFKPLVVCVWAGGAGGQAGPKSQRHQKPMPESSLMHPQPPAKTQHNGDNVWLCLLVLLICTLPLLVHFVPIHDCQIEPCVIFHTWAILLWHINPPPPYKNMRVFLFICVFLFFACSYFLRVLICETPMCSVPGNLCLQKYGRLEC